MDRRYEQPLLSEPRCFVSLQDYAGQPSDDHDRRFKTLLLTFRVRFSRPLHVDPEGTAFYYRRKFSEPLTVMTHHHRARDKVGRMLDAVRVPRRGTRSDFVGEIIDSVRRIASDQEDPPAVLRVKVEVDALVAYLPPLSESDRDCYDDGPPIYLDGPNSRNYSDDDDDNGLDDDDVDGLDDDDDDGVLRELRDRVVVQSGRGDKRILITLKAEFSLPPPDYPDSVVCTQRTFSEPLDTMVDQRHTKKAENRLALMLQWVRVPQGRRRRVGLAKKILGGVRSAVERRRHINFLVIEVVVDLRVVVSQFPTLSPSERRSDMPAIHLDDHLDFEPMFGASRESVEGLQKARVLSTMACTICWKDILICSEATLLPCSHQFHGDCKWLEKSKFCPFCLFELPR